jgi:hypothetical protein
MKKYFLAAIVAASPLLATTSAHALTVPEGSNLRISLQGLYESTESGKIELGSQMNLSGIRVGKITFDENNVSEYEGLEVFSSVGISGAFTLLSGLDNQGLILTFSDPDGSKFVMGKSLDAVVASGGTGSSSSGVVGLGTLSGDPGSFSYATSSNANSDLFTLTLSVPPEEIDDVSPIPLPAAAWMLLAGIGSLWAFRRRTYA